MKVRLPLMVQDPLTSRLNKIKTTEDFFAYRDDFFDGPITERMAVIDLDPDTGECVPGVKFIPSTTPLAHCEVPRLSGTDGKRPQYDIDSPEFKQAALLAMALRTLYLFEKGNETASDVIGRQVEWAFKSPQLLLVPRAGLGANAYYERASHSIQFFSFPSKQDHNQKIHTCLSRDIVTHETTHAILDAIAPELYDAITPQSLAIHEGLADLTAACMAFESGNVAESVLQLTRGEIDNTTAFSSIAEEFGWARDPSGKAQCLRNLYNETALGNMVEERPEPHALSLVLSGALYKLLVRIYKDLIRPDYARDLRGRPDPAYSASGLALRTSSAIFRRMVFGALDYLPPGDATFADFGRAIVAADKAMYPDGRAGLIRTWLKEEFVRRGIVSRPGALEAGIDTPDLPIEVDVEGLLSSDWVAYTFAQDHRALLRIPKELTYKIWPRYVTHRVHRLQGSSVEGRELIFKVSWTRLERTRYDPFPRFHRVSEGTTLVLDIHGKTPRVRAVLTTDQSEAHRDARANYMRMLFEQGTLRLDDRSEVQNKFPASYINGEVRNGTLRVRGTARMLHIVG